MTWLELGLLDGVEVWSDGLRRRCDVVVAGLDESPDDESYKY